MVVRVIDPWASRSITTGHLRAMRAASIRPYAACSDSRSACVQDVKRDEHPSPRYSRRASSSARSVTSRAVASRSCAAAALTSSMRARSERWAAILLDESSFLITSSIVPTEDAHRGANVADGWCRPSTVMIDRL